MSEPLHTQHLSSGVLLWPRLRAKPAATLAQRRASQAWRPGPSLLSSPPSVPGTQEALKKSLSPAHVRLPLPSAPCSVGAPHPIPVHLDPQEAQATAPKQDPGAAETLAPRLRGAGVASLAPASSPRLPRALPSDLVPDLGPMEFAALWDGHGPALRTPSTYLQ